MTAVILTVLCSSSIAIILKLNDTRNGPALVLLSANYFMAACISLLLFYGGEIKTGSPESFFFGIILGSIFVYAFFLFTLSVRVAGTALATVSSRLSVVVPVILAMVIFREIPGMLQILGLFFAIFTIYLFYRSLRNNSTGHIHLKDYLILIMLLIGIGINDFCMKLFQSWRPAAEKPFFLLCIFGSAWIYSSVYIIIKKIPVDRRTVGLGLLLGIPNIFSSYFLIAALTEVEAIVVYPLVNIGIIVVTALAAWIIWREKLNRAGVWALSTGIAAIVLLGISG
jgi:drug/metabolite transporter (DMT)-like permease